MKPFEALHRDRLEYFGYRGAEVVAQAVPASLTYPMERCAARIAARVMPAERQQVGRNLDRIYGPDLSPTARAQLVTETFSSYARYWVETLRLPHLTPQEVDAEVTVDGFHHITDGLEKGNGVILSLPHLGGWEWAAFWVTACQGHPISAVAEQLSPELTEWFVNLRRSFGIEVILLDRSAASAATRALKENRVLCLLSDRDISGSGIPVAFFGETTTLPAGPATLALRTGATLTTAATYFKGRNGHHLVVDAPIDTTRQGRLREDASRVTQEIAERLEVLIRHAPEQWHLLQPNWPSDQQA